MLRKLLAASVVLCLGLGVVLADDQKSTESKGKIVKLSDQSVSIQVFNNDTKKYDAAKSYPLTKDTRFVLVQKLEGNKFQNTPIEGGARATVFQKIPQDGLPGAVDVRDNKVVEVRLMKQQKS